MALDAELLDVLRHHCSSLGTSFTSKGASRVLAQPSNRLLFAKTGATDQVLGEAESLNAMYKASLAAGHSETLIPTIHAFGKTANGSKGFLVTDYKELSSGLSRNNQRILGKKLAEMHKNGTSDNGMYGFDRPTHCGATEQDNTWTANWKDFWAERRIGDLVQRSGDQELVALEVQLREKVYPLLFNKEAMKDVRPAIIHGDLWSGNAGTDEQSGQPIIFDPSSSYSHNEAELGIMKMFGGFGSDFFEAYHDVIPKAQPYYNERQEMYEAYHHLNHFVMFGGSYRSGTVRIFKKLIDWAEEESKKGGEDSNGNDEGGEGSSGKRDQRGLRGGNNNDFSFPSSSSTLQGCGPSMTGQYPPNLPPPGGASLFSSSTTHYPSYSSSAPPLETSFPPATPSQIADYFSQMICYLWFSSGVPGRSMPTTPSRSPTSKHLPLQSSPLAPRRMVQSPYVGIQSTRALRPTHAKTASAGNLSHHALSTSLNSNDLSKAIYDQLASSSSSSNYVTTSNQVLENDPSLRRLQPKSRFLRFSREILSTTQVSTSVITLALIYVHRLKAAHPHLKGREGSEFRLAISSLMLANKILDDNTYLNKTWAEISGMPLIEISKMEVEFWLGLKMELHISKEDYDRGLNELQLLANDRNRAVLQRDAAIRRALQQQALSQSSPWAPYMQYGFSASSDGLVNHYESRFNSPLPPLNSQTSIRRSVGNVEALSNQTFIDSLTPHPTLQSHIPTPSYDFQSVMQNYNVQTPPYFSRPTTFTLPPSPLSQASAGVPFNQQQDGIKPSYGTFAPDTLASSPSDRASQSYSGDVLWSLLNQGSQVDATPTSSMHHNGSASHMHDLSPTSVATSTSFAPAESYHWQTRPSLSTQSSSTLSTLKRTFEKTNLDTSSPLEGFSSSKRFAAEPNINDDLRHYRLSSTGKQSSQSPTNTRYSLRSRTRATPFSKANQRSTSRDDFRWSVSPSHPSALSVLASPASQRSNSSHRSRPVSAQDIHSHEPHPNYHSAFSSALTPISLAAPLDNHMMQLHQPWNNQQMGFKKVAPLQYYSLAAGEPYGNIATYLPPPINARGYSDALNVRRSSMLSDTRQPSYRSGADKASSTWNQGGSHPQTPMSAPSFGEDSIKQSDGYALQAKDDLLSSSSSYSRASAPFSMDVNAWPLTNTASSNFLFPYHFLPPQSHSNNKSYQHHSQMS